MSDKKLADNQLLGTQGTGLIELVISKMGLVWRPTTQHDAGIDGEIEIRDAGSGRMTGMLIKVQSKAVSSFQNETQEGFDYWPDSRDIRYWLAHSIPVILVVSRPATNEAYWLAVKEQVARSPNTKGFHFVKSRDKLDESSKARLIELAQANSSFGTAPALLKQEVLVTNLLPVTKLPERLYLAESTFRDGKEIGEALKGRNITFEFILKNKRILSVRDLTLPQYQDFCDRGTVEDFPVSEWADSNDPDKQRDFVNLLNRSLRQMLRSMPEGLWFDRSNSCYFFPPSLDRKSYDYGYRGDKKQTAREVFKARINKQKGHVMGFRHSAMKAQFMRLEDSWYLEITPTYFFTKNGKEQSKWHEDWLKGIKELEKNGAIRGQLMMWADILLNPPDLFGDSYPYLGFSFPLKFTLDRGIDDDAWVSSDKADKLLSESTLNTPFELI